MKMLWLPGCKRCGERFPVRITEEEQARYLLEDPQRIVGDVRCPRCQRVYVLTAAAYQQAV